MARLRQELDEREANARERESTKPKFQQAQEQPGEAGRTLIELFEARGLRQRG